MGRTEHIASFNGEVGTCVRLKKTSWGIQVKHEGIGERGKKLKEIKRHKA